MPLCISYFISFVTIGVNWVNHHHLIHVAGSVNGKMLWANLMYLFILSFIPISTGWVGRSMFAVLPVRVYVIIQLLSAAAYLLLEISIVRSSKCTILRNAIEESRKEQWTFFVEAVALVLTFIPGAHYLSCPLMIVAVAPWIVPDLRMKRVFEETKKKQG